LPQLPPHPRLLANAADWERLKARIAAEADLAAYHAALIGEARRMMPAAPMERVMNGRRLLHTTREVLRRVMLWSYAWRTTGEADFARRAEQEMLAAARFTDWNPTHFLDVGEATAGLALGYDWLHEALTPEGRTVIATAILEKGLRLGLDSESTNNHWQKTENNWNQVCFGGLTLGALAVGEVFPAEAAQTLALARARIGNGLKPYAPDGVYPEGPGYWAYGTTYQVVMIAALESVLCTDWGMKAATGFLPSAGAYLQTLAPSGRAYNFADARDIVHSEPAVLWFARELSDPWLAADTLRQFARPDHLAAFVKFNRMTPLAALWWPPADRGASSPSLPLDWYGRGKNPVVVFREAWDDPLAGYLAAKGGAGELGHAHMDAGSFVYEADGVRWAVDLGMQGYESLEAKGFRLSDRGQDGQRWKVYRLNNYSHNTLTIDGALHRVDGHAKVECFSGDTGNRLAVLDMSPVFAGQAGAVRRGFRIRPEHGFVVQDEIDGLAAGQVVRWQMATEATVTVAGDTATLTQAGRTVTLRVLAPAGASFTVGPAAPAPNDYDQANPGVSLVGCEVAAKGGSRLTLAVEVSPGEGLQTPSAVRPLAEW
jgi:hypothetical protein